jgi:hypothetical protein
MYMQIFISRSIDLSVKIALQGPVKYDPRWTFCPQGCFVPTDVLSAGCYVSGRFVPPDVLSAGLFVHPDVLSTDVMSLDVLSPDVLSGYR